MCGVDEVSSSSFIATVDTVYVAFLLSLYFGLERAYRSPLARTGFTPAGGPPSVPSGDFIGGL